jgi:hypothetical protein
LLVDVLTTFVYVACIPKHSFGIDKVRPRTSYSEQGAAVSSILQVLRVTFGMLLDQHRNDFEVRELLCADVLKHVADTRVVGMK